MQNQTAQSKKSATVKEEYNHFFTKNNQKNWDALIVTLKNKKKKY